MIIEEKDFKLTPVDNASKVFDLELLYTVNKGKSNERTEFRTEGYGLRLNTAIEKIIMYRISNKYPKEEIISLKTFLEEYKEESKKIKELCQESIENVCEDL